MGALLSSLVLQSLLLAGAPPVEDSPSVAAVLAEAEQTVADLEYDRAAALLTEVIVDEQASLAQQTRARARLAEVEIVRGFNSEARVHYLWLLHHDEGFDVPADAPPKISGFFRLVRDDWRREREKEAKLLAAAEQGREADKTTDPDDQPSLPAAQNDPTVAGPDDDGYSPMTRDREPGPSVADEVRGGPDLLSAGLVAYGLGALGALCFCGPSLVVLLNAPEAIIATACCLGGGVVAGCATPQGLGTVFLGDTVGKTRSRWAYVTTLLGSIGSFILGGLVLSGIGAAAIFGLTAAFALTTFNEDVLNTRDSDAAYLSALISTAIAAAIFVAVQPIVPLLVYAFHGGDAPADAAPLVRREQAPAPRRVAIMSY
jgi:hypothetical protein